MGSAMTRLRGRPVERSFFGEDERTPAPKWQPRLDVMEWGEPPMVYIALVYPPVGNQVEWVLTRLPVRDDQLDGLIADLIAMKAKRDKGKEKETDGGNQTSSI